MLQGEYRRGGHATEGNRPGMYTEGAQAKGARRIRVDGIETQERGMEVYFCRYVGCSTGGWGRCGGAG